MTTCRELIEFLIDYHEGTLEPSVRAEFDRHLAACRACRDYLDSYARTIELARDALDDQALADDGCAQMPEDLIRGIVRARTLLPRVPE